MTNKVETKRMSYVDFTKKFIETRKDKAYSGVHVVYSGFLEALKAYYGADLEELSETATFKGQANTYTGAKAVVQKMIASNEFDWRPASGGITLYLKGTMSKGSSATGNDALRRMGILK